MADLGDRHGFVYHIHPQPNPISAVRWLPSTSPFTRLFAMASPSALEIHSLSSSFQLSLLSSHPLPSSATSLSTSSAILAVATSAGSVHFFSFNPHDGTINSDSISISDANDFHYGPIRSIDITNNGSTGEYLAVTAGEDGRLNLVTLGEQIENVRVCDSEGLAAYTAAKWRSPVEFVTGGVGVGLQCWDTRQPDGPVSHFKSILGGGMIHSIDIHSSRKHTCVVGGSNGTVFAWDLRYQNEAIVMNDSKTQNLSHSEIWEVKYDNFTPLISSNKVLPVMVCSEDGYLAVLKQDEDPVQLLDESCAINSFDIDPQNPSDVIVALEWESVGILSRGKESINA